MNIGRTVRPRHLALVTETLTRMVPGSRAQQILAAAKAEGAALKEIVAGIDEGWVESLTLRPSP
jgi:hypothetical protein